MKNIKTKRKNTTEEGVGNGISLIKGTIFAYLITIVVFIIYGSLLTYTNITEKHTQTIVMITTVISMLVSGFISSRGFKNKGLIYGMVAGLIYATIMIMMSFCILPSIKITSKMIMILVLSISAGGIGGIIGVNLKK